MCALPTVVSLMHPRSTTFGCSHGAVSRAAAGTPITALSPLQATDIQLPQAEGLLGAEADNLFTVVQQGARQQCHVATLQTQATHPVPPTYTQAGSASGSFPLDTAVDLLDLKNGDPTHPTVSIISKQTWSIVDGKHCFGQPQIGHQLPLYMLIKFHFLPQQS
jgi:hypothetical protein